jgi:D-alanyl-D-alanine carboxypeptidase
VDVDLLARGTEEQVRTRTRGILESCAPSRGYVLGSGNSITNYVSPRNYLAMLDEGWRYNSR